MDKTALSDWLQILSMFAGFVFILASAMLTLAWWLFKQFSSVKTMFFEKMEKLEDKIVGKLEYHEKHDDIRFSQITDALLDIRLKDAARHGLDHDAQAAKINSERRTRN